MDIIHQLHNFVQTSLAAVLNKL